MPKVDAKREGLLRAASGNMLRFTVLIAFVVLPTDTALVTPLRPEVATWRRTLCGTVSSIEPAIPAGRAEVGTDYPGNDLPPCGAAGCTLRHHATVSDCSAKCRQTGLCVGYVFVDSNCSGKEAPVCFTKAAFDRGVSAPCHVSQLVGYPGSNGTEILTKWTAEVSPENPLPEYPRPQMVRTTAPVSDGFPNRFRATGDAATWQSLNGLWEWERAQTSDKAPLQPPFNRKLNGSILVPFPYESCLSGVAPSSPEDASATMTQGMWYRLTFLANRSALDGRTILHFGAIDWQSVFYIDGRHIANHTGGYDAIDIDISELIQSPKQVHELLVYVHDPSNLGNQPNGKQNLYSSFFPGGGQYTPTSGIWQTVWLEVVPPVYIANLSIGQNSLDTVTISASIEGSDQKTNALYVLAFSVFKQGSGVAIATGGGSCDTAVALAIPSPRQWGPDDPYLYDLKVVLLLKAMPVAVARKAAVVDHVVGYFGLRSFRVGKEHANAGATTRPLLNGEFKFLAGWLDQVSAFTSSFLLSLHTLTYTYYFAYGCCILGRLYTKSWWPDGQYTAPTDNALASDLQAVSKFGFNLARLHMKVNPERWYYHADTLGVVVFQDMVQKICVTKCTNTMMHYYLSDLKKMMNGRKNHPCIVQFTLLNEEDMWHLFDGAPFDLPRLLDFARALAPDHLIDMESGSNGGYSTSISRARLGDVVDYHTYPAPRLKPNATETQYAMLGEFGGVGAFVAGKEWRPPTPKQKSCFAYNLPLHPLDTPTEEAQAYINMTTILLSWTDQISASVYTQITDVELECDGFLNYDRTDKFDDRSIAAIKAANLRLTQPDVS